ncbi:MAG: penicillin-binding transpeptidase domain-containing protein [Acutalibacteraceae bacterium]
MSNFKIPKNVSSKRTDRSFRENSKKMLAVIMACLAALGVFRVGFIMLVKGSEYRSDAEQNQLYDQVIPAVRGTIYDSNMTPLVTSSSAWILTVDPWSIYNEFAKKFRKKTETGYDYTYAENLYKQYCDFMGGKIAKVLELEKKDVKNILSGAFDEDGAKIQYKRIKNKITASVRLKLDELLTKEYDCEDGKFYVKIEGQTEKPVTIVSSSFFEYENDNIRFYPDNNFASTVIGVTNYDGDGVTGVEAQYNSVLKGTNGRRVTAKDANGNAIDSSYETIIDAEEGNGVVLTIDSNIQLYLENALSQALKNTKAQGTYGIVMDVDTGAILAISNKPDFDLNDAYTLVDENAVDEILAEAKEKGKEMTRGEARTTALYNQWNSFCITSTYEPGSTFKIFTASAALEEGVANLSTTYTCTGGYKIPNGPTIHCAKTEGHGTQTFTQGLMNSCNPFFINLGQKLGSETYYKYFEAFGFTEKTGIDLPGEANSVYHSKENLKVTELASTSFGQSFRISPIQLITAACSIANGGKLMKPYVVDSIVDVNGNVISKTEPTVRRQVISESTAATVRNMMEAVVEGGTGKNAYIPGYRVAGKTATSEKLDDDEKREQMKYVASFVCFAPADDPKVAVLVGVDEPSGEYRGGGVVAAPIAKEVMESTLKYLNVQPQYTQEELESVSKTAPNLVGESVGEAKVTAANNGLTVKVIGDGESVVSQVPAAGQSVPKGGIIVVYTDGNSETKTVSVPNFKGMSASEANSVAHEAGINIVLSGPSSESGAVAYNQSVAADSKVSCGSSVTVYFHTTTQAAD